MHVLVTSRVALRLDGEQQFAVPPLPVRNPDRPVSGPPRNGDGADALTLFIDRARAVDPAFTIGPDTMHEVVDLCRRLDGLPLAIELAAANLKLFLPGRCWRGSKAAFRCLAVAAAIAVPASKPASRGRLELRPARPDEQSVFRVLGAFVGCRLEEAEAVCTAVCGYASPVLDAFATLIDHSLLRREDTLRGTRWRATLAAAGSAS